MRSYKGFVLKFPRPTWLAALGGVVIAMEAVSPDPLWSRAIAIVLVGVATFL